MESKDSRYAIAPFVVMGHPNLHAWVAETRRPVGASNVVYVCARLDEESADIGLHVCVLECKMT